MGALDRPLGKRPLGGFSVANRGRSSTPRNASYPAGSFTFIAPASGWFRFVMWGAGARSNQGGPWGGPSGAFVLAERPLAQGQRVSLVVADADNTPINTTATFPDGEVLTAGSGDRITPAVGVATANRNRGDIAINGSLANANGGGNNGGTSKPGNGTPDRSGGGAPGWAGYRGGDGAGSASGFPGSSPGGGGSVDSGVGTFGGGGLVLIEQVRLRP